MSEFSRDLAVVIGINDYQNGIPALQTAQPDADRMAQILEEERYGYEVKRFLDKEATSQEIWKYLKTELPQVLQQLQPRQTRLLVYFAGHGTPPKGEDGEGGFLLPQDASKQNKEAWLSMQDILTALKDLKCHHLLVILDCCYAGAILLDSHRDVELDEVEELSQERYSRYIKESVWQIITSAAHDQKAIDILDDTRGISKDDPKHSPFAKLLFDALENEAADYTKDGITTATELHVYLYEKLYEQTANQAHPQVSRTWTLPGYDKGEFIFQTGEFDPAKLPEALILDQANNPYRGLKSFDESHSRFFFGRTAVIKDLQERVSNRPLTIVLGASGSGKSSVVKAGLIPALREDSTQQWQILEPIRPGTIPFRALATAVLPLTVKAEVLDVRPFQKIHGLLRQARKRSPNDKALNELFAQWRRTSPEEKLLLAVEHFDSLKGWCGDVATVSLQDLRQQGLKLSKLMQWHEASPEKLKKFKEKCSDVERKQIERSIEEWKQKVEQWSGDWQQDGKQFGEFIQQHCPPNGSIKQLLVIDQFEELITQCNETDRQQFLAALEAALGACPQLRLVLTLRDDFQYYFEDVDPLKRHWKESCFRVEAMRREQLREAIEGPAQAQVLFFEEIPDRETGTSRSLVDEILDDLGDSPGALPLLSFTLSELYYKYVQSDRGDRTFTHKDYDDLGGVKKALTKRATQEYNDLAKDDENGQKIDITDAAEVKARQDMCRWVMLRMVADDGDGRAKRRVLEPALTYGDPKKDEHRALVIDRFVNARLLVQGNNLKGIPYVEPAHDVLVREWISTWLDKTQVASSLTSPQKPWLRLPGMTRKSEPTAKAGNFDMTLQRALEVAARDWDEASRNLVAGFKAQVPMLSRSASSERQNPSSNAEKAGQPSAKSANAWLWHNNTRLPLAEEVLKSIDNNWLNQLETKFIQRSINLRERNRRTRGGLIATAFTIVLMFGFVQWKQNQEAQSINLAASSKTRFASDQQLEALIESIKSGKTLRRVIGADAETTHKVVASLLQTISNVKERNRLQGHLKNISEFGFSSDGNTLILKSQGGAFQYLNLEGNEISALNNKSFRLQSCDRNTGSSYSPDGKIQANWDWEGYLTLLDLNRQKDQEMWKIKALRGGHNGQFCGVYFSPNGQIIASVSPDNTIKLWSVEDKTINKFKAHNSTVNSVRFSPGSKSLASVGKDNLVRIWSLEGKESKSLPGGGDEILSIDFSSDGRYLAYVNYAADLDKRTIVLSNLETNKTKTFFANAVDAVFSPDSKMIASAGFDGQIKFWDLEGLSARASIPAHKNIVYSVNFSPDGKMLISSAKEGLAKLWDLSKGADQHGKEIGLSNRGPGQKETAEFSPDGKILAIESITDNGLTRLFSIGGKELRSIVGKSVSFSSDSKMIASSSKDGNIKLWSIEGEELATFKEGNSPVTSLSFSPDGKTLASANEDGTIVLWNLGLDELLSQACARVRGYLKNNPNVPDSDRHLCDGISDSKSSESASIATPTSTSQVPASTPSLPPLPCSESLPPALPDKKSGYYILNGSKYSYIGSMEKIPPPDGQQVTQLFPDGIRYDGGFKDGKRNGCGMLSFDNSKRYVGQFANDKYDGIGKFTGKNGEYYQGQFSEGKCNGKGTLIFTDGTFKTGNWRDGKLDSDPDISCDKE